MFSIVSMYPPLSERPLMSPLYVLSCFILLLLPIFYREKRIAVHATFFVLLILCLRQPYYTFGDASSNYYSSGTFFAMPLWYLDFLILTPSKGPDSPVFNGKAKPSSEDSEKGAEEIDTDLQSIPQTFRRTLRLMIPPNRGIGWNWQIKGVLSDHLAEIPRWIYVTSHLKHVFVAYIFSVAMLVIMGFSSALQEGHLLMKPWQEFALNAAIGWSGAAWVWTRLTCFYSFAAAMSVACGLCETWEWPPLMGDLKDAWSVRQMWSSVYHQMMRRMVSQPALRITRFLRLRKGSLTSRYSQLFVSFAISCLYHEFQIFNVTRKDGGEFAFFMSQPLAIMGEDGVQWIWHKFPASNKYASSARTFGYLWMFLWFSYSLPFYVKSLRDAEIIRDVLFDSAPFQFGFSIANNLTKS